MLRGVESFWSEKLSAYDSSVQNRETRSFNDFMNKLALSGRGATSNDQSLLTDAEAIDGDYSY